MNLRVLLVDDHTLFRVGLVGLLEHRGIEVVAAVGSGAEGLDRAVELDPDVILLDMRMPGMDGLAFLRELRQRGYDTPVLMLTTSSEERDVVDSLRGGAQGYVLKDVNPDELVRALTEVVQGKTYVTADLTPLIARVVGGQNTLSSDASPFDGLTRREREILRLLADGQSNKVMARNLGISDGTVKLHVKAVLRKLDVHSRVEAAVLAVEHGLRGGDATDADGEPQTGVGEDPSAQSRHGA